MRIESRRRKRFVRYIEMVNEWCNLFTIRECMQSLERNDGQGNCSINLTNDRQGEFASVGHLPHDARTVGNRRCSRRNDVERAFHAAVRNIA
jgi:hypothetical protein